MTSDPATEPGNPALELVADLRCASVTASIGEPAAGTATKAAGFVLVELGGAWPKPIISHPSLGGVDAQLADASPIRLLGIGAETPPADAHRVISYVPGDKGDGLVGLELVVGPDDLAAAVDSILAGARLGAPVAPGTTEFLICTQGSHDRCCGRYGTLLHNAIHEQLGSSVRVWRTSHTGGHRFAPTGITLPDAINWAGLDPAMAEGIAKRTVHPGDIASSIRGRSTVGDRAAQIIDVEAFAHLGWDWLEGVHDHTVSHTDDRVVVDITVRSDSSRRRVRGELRQVEAIVVPKCGEPLESAYKSTPQFRLESFEIAAD